MDPDANLAMGRYRCFVKRNWKDGLPMLALGSDPALAGAAAQELQWPPSAQRQALAGQAWWSVAESASGSARRQIQTRAARLSKQALATLPAGLTRDSLEKRVREFEAQAESSNPFHEAHQEPAPGTAAQPAAPSEQPQSRPSYEAASKPAGKGKATGKTPAARWLVLLRSADPRIWNRDVNRGPNDYAISLAKVPGDIRFLRLSVAKKNMFVIIPMSRDRLAQCSDDQDRILGWNGEATNHGSACDLGIYNSTWMAPTYGVVHIRDTDPGTMASGMGAPGMVPPGMMAPGPMGPSPMGPKAGWGFGLLRMTVNFRGIAPRPGGGLGGYQVTQTPEGQGYAWAGKTLPAAVVFEIAVTGANLSDSERMRLLKK